VLAPLGQLHIIVCPGTQLPPESVGAASAPQPITQTNTNTLPKPNARDI
jgi:hypothetical protein